MTDTSNRDQIFVGKLIAIIHANIGNESFGVNELANESGFSLYTLARRLHAINGKTVNQFIREVRLQRAMELLLKEENTVSEVAFKTGFGSPAYFNKCFHKHFGYSPGKVKKGEVGNDESDRLNNGIGKNKPGDFRQPRLINYAGTLFLILVIATSAYFINTRVQKSGNKTDPAPDDSRISIAVMPFQNMTNDTLWNIWQDGIQINLITSLSNSDALKVRQTETVNNLLRDKGYTSYVSITPSAAVSISRLLDADMFVSGAINKGGNTIRLNAQLIKTVTGESLRSFQIDGQPENILRVTDSLSWMISNSLLIYKFENERKDELPETHSFPTDSPEAYRYYILGQTAFFNNDFPTAIKYFKNALDLDSSLVTIPIKISTAYYNQGNFEEAREWCIKSHEKIDQMPLKERIGNDAFSAVFFETHNDRIRHLRRLLVIDDQNPLTWFNIGDCYYEMGEDEKAIPEFEKALELFHKWETKPYWGAFYYELGICYHRTGQYKKEKKLYRKADRDFPDDPGLMDQHAWLELALGDTVAANRYIEKWITVRKEEAWSEARIESYLAYVYDMAGMPENTEACLRKALSLEPDNPARMSSLANFLIDRERDVAEGMELVDKALELKPDNYNFLHNKGWGLYKQGKYTEAVELLQKSWDLRMQSSIYNHKAFQHLEKAKAAAAGSV